MGGLLLSVRNLKDEAGSAASEQPVNMQAITWQIALTIGCCQAFALLPGISRSGLTILAGIWLGCARKEVATFSFLTVTPLILGAMLLKMRKGLPGLEEHALSYTLGGLVAFAVGYGALVLLFKMLSRGSLHVWGYYLFAVAIAYGVFLQL